MPTSTREMKSDLKFTSYSEIGGELSKVLAESKAKDGIYCDKPLNGYHKVSWSELHQVDEEKRERIKQIFELATAGDYALRTLALECTRIGFLQVVVQKRSIGGETGILTRELTFALRKPSVS